MFGSGGSCVTDPSLALFESVVCLLGPVLDKLVFVEGCTTGLFLTDLAAGGIRPTKDVDAIVEANSYGEYISLGEKLRALGLAEDTSPGAPLCRWRRDDIIVDIMPMDASVRGFSSGGGDVFASHDIEDIVTVVDGRPEIVEEVAGADAQVRSFISSEIRSLLDNPDFADALPGLLPPDASSQARQRILGERLRALSGIAPI